MEQLHKRFNEFIQWIAETYKERMHIKSMPYFISGPK